MAGAVRRMRWVLMGVEEMDGIGAWRGDFGGVDGKMERCGGCARHS